MASNVESVSMSFHHANDEKLWEEFPFPVISFLSILLKWVSIDRVEHAWISPNVIIEQIQIRFY